MQNSQTTSIDFLSFNKNDISFWSIDFNVFKTLSFEHWQILLNLFGQYEIKIFDEINLNNNCQCSNERVLNTFKSMDQTEIKFLFNNKKSIEVVCEFCKTKRYYSEQDLI